MDLAPPEILDATLARIVFESSLDGVVIVDESGRALEANAAALALPFARIEPLLTSPDQPDAELHAFHEQIRARGRAATEVRVSTVTGGLRLIAIEGRAVGSRRIFFLRDVTPLRAAQEELSAVRRLESLGHFTATLAHDLNNVLAPIGCLTDMLVREAGEGTPPSVLARDIAGLAKSGAELVRSILAFARGAPSKPRTIDMNAHLEKMRGLLGRLLGKGIELSMSLERAPSPVLVDPVVLEHTLLNLVANARDAIHERGLRGKITVRTANVLLGFAESEAPGALPRGQYVMLAVTDDGVGMTPGVAERALDPFFTTKDGAHGLGLGLANAKRFAVSNGGDLSLRSDPGDGTTITMHLPQATWAD
jgi:signal transduction histidine kinase